MPFDNDADLGALKPLFGEPEEIAETLRQFVAEGVSSIQIHLDSTTPQAVERLAPVLEAFDAG
jgi:alkanesulfonate monooxygenase SsuD/methylene tetrahydromethanopterin reductase-like flavin-dependent oxidoreductase (luciferase family)